MDKINQIFVLLQNEILSLKQENEQLKEHLKKYTNPDRKKKYYEAHKEEILKKAAEKNIDKEYNVSKEKKKEYNRRAYLKRKQSVLENSAS